MDTDKHNDRKARTTSRSRSRPPAKQKSYGNPYLNFVRDFRKSQSSNLSYKEILIRAGKVWRRLPPEEKQKYIEEAFLYSRDSPPKKGAKKKPKGTSDKKKNTKNSKKKPAKRRMTENDGTSISSYDSDY